MCWHSRPGVRAGPRTPSVSLTMTLSHVDLVMIDQNKWPLSKHSSPEELALRTLPCATQCGVLNIKTMMEVGSDREQRMNPVSGMCPCLFSNERARWDLLQYHLELYPRGKGSSGSLPGVSSLSRGKEATEAACLFIALISCLVT